MIDQKLLGQNMLSDKEDITFRMFRLTVKDRTVSNS